MKAAEEMTREELIAYDKWLTRRKWGTGEIISPEKAADLYLAEQPLPPAEGAEEILNKLLGNPGDSINVNSYQIKPLMVDGKAEWWIVHHGVGSGEPLTQWLNEFTTLHAQRIADKMVEEMLREELIAFGKVVRSWGIAIPSDILECSIDEYLKSRER